MQMCYLLSSPDEGRQEALFASAALQKGAGLQLQIYTDHKRLLSQSTLQSLQTKG